METAERLLAELKEHADAQELMKEYGTIETVSDYAGALLSTAQKLGIETKADVSDLVRYLESVEASERDSTEQAAVYMRELDDDDLENIAGGIDGGCGNGADDKWSHAFECWTNDKCATQLWN